MLKELIRGKLCEKVFTKDLDQTDFAWGSEQATSLVKKLNAMQHSLEVLSKLPPAEICDQIWSAFIEEAPQWLSNEFIKSFEHTKAKLATFMRTKYDQVESALKFKCQNEKQALEAVANFFDQHQEVKC